MTRMRFLCLACLILQLKDLRQYSPDSTLLFAFLVPTPTGYKKSIMDAIAPVRDLLYDSHVHDFQMQPQGPDNKHVVPAFFVQSNGLVETQASLYRPITKKGDPRIWFYDLKKHCHPCNLLALTVIDEAIYIFNLSDPAVADSLLHQGLCI